MRRRGLRRSEPPGELQVVADGTRRDIEPFGEFVGARIAQRNQHAMKFFDRVCLGNDGMPVNNTADMFREMRSALLMHRNNEGNPTYPTAAEAIEMATINGARGIMAEDAIGSLEAEKRADIILIDTQKPHLVPVHDPLSAVVWAANGSDVDTVLIDGQVVMEGRHVLTLDEAQIMEDVSARKEKIVNQANVDVEHVWPLL